MANTKLDIILFGASGFTGQHCLSILEKLCISKGRSLKWGAAGRNKKKIEDALQQQGQLNNIPIIIADIYDEQSLIKMAKSTKLLINCCGPFRLYGEAVVKACIKAKTHYIDVTGEIQFIEEIQLKYNDEAKKNDIYIISACGIDSIPNDLGVIYLNNKFDGVLNSVESYLKGGVYNYISGPIGNFATWESAIFVMGFSSELKQIRQNLFPERLPKFEPKLMFKFYPRLSSIVNGWILPFPNTDKSVVRRTQRYFYYVENKRPIQFQTYFVVDHLLYVLLLAIIAPLFLLLTKFAIGRYLLLQFPKLFSFGIFSKSPPSETNIQNTWFQITLLGKGWAKGTNTSNRPNKSLLAKIKGRNPGYGTTCICLALAAIVILTEKDKLPLNGGVYSPGVAFAKTSLIQELNENGITFEVI